MKLPSTPKTLSATALTMKCPRCEKRAFDVSNRASNPLAIQLKCPHCKNIVTINLPTTQDRTS